MSRYFFSAKTLGSDIVAGLTLGIERVPDVIVSGLLAGISDETIDQFENTGYTDYYRRENLFRGIERVFESILEAQLQALKWITEQED